MTIRFASVEDAASLLRIYAQYINTAITFEYALPTEQEFARRIAEICADYPYLICEEEGRPIGYAYAHRQMERAAYQWNVELSIYLDRTATSNGIGQRLYAALIELLRLQGIKTVYGGVTLPNIRSERLHEKLGFHRLGTYHHTGYKCGAWHDVVWFEKAIAPYQPEPQPIIPMNEIPEETKKDILAKYA